MTSSSTPPRVGFLGLGLMGSGMANRLLQAGFSVSVYNRNSAKSAPLAAAGAHVAETPREAAAGVHAVISMVADDAAARSVWLERNGALEGISPGTVCVESSTVSVPWIHELSAAVNARGAEFLDAPVTGSRTQAASGELNFLVGGSPATLEKVRPILTAMSKTITPLGPVGSGALVKLINNFVCGVQVAALAEAVVMIERGGLERATALEVLTAGAPGSPLVKAIAGRISKADYTPHFLARLMAKDLSYARTEAAEQGLNLATAAGALEIFRNAISAGLGEQDISAVVESLRRTGLPQSSAQRS